MDASAVVWNLPTRDHIPSVQCTGEVRMERRWAFASSGSETTYERAFSRYARRRTNAWDTVGPDMDIAAGSDVSVAATRWAVRLLNMELANGRRKLRHVRARFSGNVVGSGELRRRSSRRSRVLLLDERHPPLAATGDLNGC